MSTARLMTGTVAAAAVAGAFYAPWAITASSGTRGGSLHPSEPEVSPERILNPDGRYGLVPQAQGPRLRGGDEPDPAVIEDGQGPADTELTDVEKYRSLLAEFARIDLATLQGLEASLGEEAYDLFKTIARRMVAEGN